MDKKINLPLFYKKPMKVGDFYPISDLDNETNKMIQITSKENWEFPNWVKFGVRYVNNDGSLSKFEDFTDVEGKGFVNCWGPSIIRTKYELFCYNVQKYNLSFREKLANKIFPRD